MSTFSYSTKNRFALLTALGVAAVMASSHASAGTQLPPWKAWRLKQAAKQQTPPVLVTQDSETQDDGDGAYVEQDGKIEGKIAGKIEGKIAGVLGKGGPAAAPTPSAVAGGLAMIGLLAGRRRRQA